MTLVDTYDPETDDAIAELDMFSYYTWAEGWASRTYRIEDGPSAGVLVRFSADARGARFPLSSRIVHAGIVPATDQR